MATIAPIAPHFGAIVANRGDLAAPGLLRPLAGSAGAGLRPGCGRRPAAFGLAGRRCVRPRRPDGLADAGGRASPGRQRRCKRPASVLLAGRFRSGLRGAFAPPPALSPALMRQERRAGARRYPAGFRRVCAGYGGCPPGGLGQYKANIGPYVGQYRANMLSPSPALALAGEHIINEGMKASIICRSSTTSLF
jgi:hypothetical protein